jgi:CDP-diacylglycerol--glycerol-3-phosphate 3-phosphatidyltransferase
MAIPVWFIMDDFDQQPVRNLIAGLCLFAAFTDVLDGYLARKLNEVTELGKIIDPLADKVIVGAVVIKMFLLGEIPEYYFYLMIGRDVVIFIGGIIVSKKLGKVLPSNAIGKLSIVVISLVLLFIMFSMDRTSLVFQTFYYSSIALVFISLFAYAYRGFEFIKKKEHGTV